MSFLLVNHKCSSIIKLAIKNFGIELIHIKENNVFGMQSNLNNFAKEFYGASSAARLYASSFANISNEGIVSALKAQMNAYKSIAPASNSLEQVFKVTKPINESLGQFNSKVLQNYMSSQTTKQIESINRRLQRSIPTAGLNSSAALGKELRRSMEPFFNSGNLKTMTSVNNVFNKINTHPYASYEALQKAISDQVAPGLDELDKAVRDQIKKIEEEGNKSQSRSNSERWETNTKAAIKELQNPIKINKSRDKHFKFSMEYFIILFQFLILILYTNGIITSDSDFTKINIFLEIIDKAITTYQHDSK